MDENINRVKDLLVKVMEVSLSNGINAALTILLRNKQSLFVLEDFFIIPEWRPYIPMVPRKKLSSSKGPTGHSTKI
jgi:hypothetical protein